MTGFPYRPAMCMTLAALLGACAPPAPRTAPPPDAATQPAVQPDALAAYYLRAAASGQQVLRIDAARSLIGVTVRRDGALARLGHDHLVASRTLDGYVAPGQQRADFHFRLDQMSVDEVGLRNEAGLSPQPSDGAIEGTRHNMLYKVLDADNFPRVFVHVQGGTGKEVEVTINLHGVSRTLRIPVEQESGPDSLSISGSVSFKQSDFGLVPFAILNGAIAVRDQLDLRFHIVANRVKS